MEEAQSMFKSSKNSFIKTEQPNAYRVDVGLGGLVAFGGDFLSIVREEQGGELTDIERDFEDSKTNLI